MGNNAEQMNVKFTKEQREIIHSLIGVMGGTEPEVVRTIIVSWLSEKGVISDIIKKRWTAKQKGD